MTHVTPEYALLSVYPVSQGFGYVLFETPDAPFDWGLKHIQGKKRNARVHEAVEWLIDRYHPSVLILENTDDEGCKRDRRIRRLYRLLADLAKSKDVEVRKYTQKEVRATFHDSGARTKHEIARVIASRIPAFGHRMPRERKPWMSEDPRQALFDAAALALSHYART